MPSVFEAVLMQGKKAAATQNIFAAKRTTQNGCRIKNSSMELAVIWGNFSCSDLAYSDLAHSDLAHSDLAHSDLARSD